MGSNLGANSSLPGICTNFYCLPFYEIILSLTRGQKKLQKEEMNERTSPSIAKQLNTKAVALLRDGRYHECLGILQQALQVSRRSISASDVVDGTEVVTKAMDVDHSSRLQVLSFSGETRTYDSAFLQMFDGAFVFRNDSEEEYEGQRYLIPATILTMWGCVIIR